MKGKKRKRVEEKSNWVAWGGGGGFRGGGNVKKLSVKEGSPFCYRELKNEGQGKLIQLWWLLPAHTTRGGFWKQKEKWGDSIAGRLV